MTDGQILWLAVMSLFLLCQTVFMLTKMVRNRTGGKEQKSEGNPGYGERLAGLEKEVEGMKENNEKDHSLIRQDIQKLFTLFSRAKG